MNSFGGFPSKSRSFVSEASGGEKMVADGFSSYNNIMSTAANAMSLQSSYSQPLFTTPPLSISIVCILLSNCFSVCVCVCVNQFLVYDSCCSMYYSLPLFTTLLSHCVCVLSVFWL